MGDTVIITVEPQRADRLEESRDELIEVLLEEGRKYYSEEDSYEMYIWVLTSYVKVKCRLYRLDYLTAMQFLEQLHTAIARNQHRLKEIEGNFKEMSRYLYVFPILKEQSKIILNHSLFELFHIKQLFDSILEQKWGRRL